MVFSTKIRPWHRYFAAILIVTGAALVRLWFLQSLGPRIPYVTFYPAVMIAALIGGLPAGLLATALSSFLAAFFWIEPVGQVFIKDRSDWLGMAVFLASCSIISGASALMHRIHGRLKEAEARAGCAAELARAEGALRSERALLQALLHAIPDLVWLKDPEGVYIACNRMIERVFGAPEKEIVGRTDHDFVAAAVADSFRDRDRVAMAAGGPCINEEWVTFASDGHRALLETIKTPMHDADGRLIGVVGIARDITLRKEAEEAMAATIDLLRICNRADTKEELLRDLALHFQQVTGCEAVGVRLRKGDDFPYFETRGLAGEFVLAENSLCALDPAGELIRDDAGHPAFACMCGSVIRGRFDPAKPFFTERGSFWSNCTTNLLATTTDADRQAKTRNRCNGEGYESVALVPLRSHGETLGLFQFNDRRKGRFTPAKIALLEDLVAAVASALAKLKSDEALLESSRFNQQIIDGAGEGVVVYGRDQCFQVWNQYMEKMSGLPADRVIGRHPLELFPLLRKAGILGRIGLALAGETPPPIDFKYQSPVTGGPAWATSTNVPLRNTKGEIVGVIGTVREITALKLAEKAILASEKRYHSLFENMREGIAYCRMLFDGENRPTDFVYLDVNGAFTRLTGLEDVVGRKVTDVIPGIREVSPELFEVYGRVALTGEPERFDFDFKSLSSWLSISVYSPGKDYFIAVFDDITERKHLEEQLRQSQKMEAIGQLAGGVAHDFNNILTAIIGFASLMEMGLQEDDRKKVYAKQILVAAERAADLTRSLLAFSRKQIINPKPTDLNQIIRKMETFLQRIMGEDIGLKTTFHEKKLTVHVDSGQIEQVLMNLAANTRDAMPTGGMMMIETESVELTANFIAIHGYGKLGDYALVSITDTGIGMDETTRKKAFDPFFTTKEMGKGTGLGLSIAYGIVKQHNGFINVHSELGVGTIFTIYLPLVREAVGSTNEIPNEAPAGGTETVLLADDDASLRDLAETVLIQFGYTVITAVNGHDALEKFSSNQERISLVILDVIMPRMNGKEAFDRIRMIRPDCKVIFISGYTADIIHKRGILDENLEFVTKPLGPAKLLRKVREILDKTG